MMNSSSIVLLFIFSARVLGSFAHVSSQPRADTTVVSETAYSVLPSYGGKFKVLVAIVTTNPFEDRFASRPSVRVTLSSGDGSVISTREVSSAGIPPKGRIAFCETLSADEVPAKVEFRPLDADYKDTVYRAQDFLSFDLLNIRTREDGTNGLRITGEIKNPYNAETGVWITFLYRDETGKLLGGHTKYESTLLSGDPTPFEMYVRSDEIPANTKSVERLVFDHNNYLASWDKLLRH